MTPKASERALMFDHTKRQQRLVVWIIAFTLFTLETLFWVVEPGWAKVFFKSVGLLMFVLLCVDIMHLFIDPVT